ncbi:sugar-binding protein [Puniceicoccus vermicola]|uniref:FlgD Ig-like domain-containing protein n=1 Tax=Puniceicoccus vermicola TaxID=388746 RepID=A0A7X1AZP4_9BACT|nr:sugar-binding protein [Puniceicoccus vermicola]MBC2602951.1 hypothetical protein [Puniceicoccus vermicola]
MKKRIGMYRIVAFICLALMVSTASGRGRNKQLYAVPAQGKITIDGKLDDWDLSGQILSYVVPETQDMQSARTAMMYDDEALYISGIVRDTSPMMNRHDPNTNPEKAWDADVCQLFFSLDPDEDLPLKYSQFKRQHDQSPVGSLMMWYFTDRKEACLAMFQGMKFNKPLRPDLRENGVIPHEYYSGAYREQEDGGGYTFEYRIPWETFNLKRVPKADDILAMSMAVFWSRPDGLKTAGGAAWAYDVMSGPGFSFQSSAVWGKLVFWPENNIDESMITAGMPPEKPLPLKFSYDVPEDSEISVQLYSEEGEIVRMLVPQQYRRAGKNTEMWDGLDDQGLPLPAGKYIWKGIYHEPIKAEWRLSVNNSGTPPYPTDDNKGGWGGDHGRPSTVCSTPDGMLLAWSACEYGWGIIRVDLDGKKMWGSKHSATYVSADDKHIFLAGGHGFNSDPSVQILDLKDSRPMSLENGKPTFIAPEGGTDETNEVTGLDCANGKLYVSYAQRNLIGVFDIRDGSISKTLAVPSPERLAVAKDGTVLVISEGKIVAIKEGKSVDLITTNLDSPSGVDVAEDGTIYVANRGELQNISVFDPSGKYLKSIGKDGGRPAKGRYDRSGMYMSGGMELDSEGRLWVAETTDGPKRISVWDTESGENVDEFFGASAYFGYGYIDPDQPDMMFAHYVLWKLDWENLKGYPYTTIWRKTEPTMMVPPGPSGYSSVTRFITAENGRQYAWGTNRPFSVLSYRDGDLFKPCAAFFSIKREKGQEEYQGTEIPFIDSDAETYPNGSYFWQDKNNDQCLQPDEVLPFPGKFNHTKFAWLQKDLGLWLGNNTFVMPTEITETGQPVYDVLKAQETVFSGNVQGGNVRHGYFARDEEGNLYSFNRGMLGKWNPDGKREWYYDDIVNWHKALNMPITGPGRLWGMSGIMGGVSDRYFGTMTYFGPNHIFRDDGMYVAAVLKDGRVGGRADKKGTQEGQPEGQNGQFVMLNIDGEDRFFIIHGGQDSRVWEVLNLDTVKDLEGGIYHHSNEQVELAAAAMEEYNAFIADTKRLIIVRGKSALETSQPVGRSVDSNRGFKARVAYDAENMYFKFDVDTPFELTNAEPESKLIFRGGNIIDIQLATDLKADPARKTPAPGDIRILITRKNGKPFAMLYETKVKDFEGEPIVFESPTGSETFDRIEVFEDFELTYHKTLGGFEALVTIPLEALGITELKPGEKIKMDLGYIFGNNQGTRTAARSHARNNSFTANVTNDIPHESRLEPAEWGEATVE